ncbi:MAG TPA: hypothetical protein VKU92_08050, partial [Acidimicrobiales bacterium]|nr:hypothetical protein [Acidimicrobiales bacterium]
MPPPGHCPWAKPERWGYVLDRHVRRIAHPRGLTLLGGEPPRLLTLGHRGVAALDALCARPPRPLPDGAAELARRLVDGALLHPVPLDAASCGSPPPGELGGAVPCGCFRLAAVVPAHAPPPGLSSLVRGLTARGVPVQVV